MDVPVVVDLTVDEVPEIATRTEPAIIGRIPEVIDLTEADEAEEVTKPPVMVQAQEVTGPNEMTQEVAEATGIVQEVVQPTEMVQIQEIAKPTEIVQIQEIAKPTEMVLVQEVAEPIKVVQEIAESMEMVQTQDVIEPTKTVQVQELAEATGMVQEIAEPTDLDNITTQVINMVISEVIGVVAADCSELDKITSAKVVEEKDITTPTEVTDIPVVTESDRETTPVKERELMELADLSSEPGTSSSSSIIYEGGGQRERHPQKEFYSRYIYKVFQKRHPGYEISVELVRIIDNMLNSFLEKVVAKASRLKSRKRKIDIITSQDIQAAVLLSLPNKMARQAAQEAIKAVESYIRTMDS